MLSRAWRRLATELRRLGLSPSQAASAVGLFILASVSARQLVRLAPKPPAAISLSATLRLLREQRIQELVYTDGGQMLLRLKSPKAVDSKASLGAVYKTMLVPGSEAAVFQLADKTSVPSVRYMPAARGISQLVSVALQLVFLYFWYRAAKSLISREDKNSLPQASRRPRESTTFADVVGKCKVELAEIVDFLNRPQRYREAGARLPRGALLVGPSGTGKTLLARAVAGEARCHFLTASASEFVEVYVGRGAARVRELFRQAREMTPVVLFIDELDALGSRSRGNDGRGTNEEYVQTLNQLLTELDGFHGHSDGVVVLAATNRHEAIDPSLLRPGRFDRHIFVELPDEEERLEILRIHTSRASMAADPEAGVLQHIASAAQGFSGAELANVVNEAVFLALRARRSRATLEDFTHALERARLTRQRAQGVAAAQSSVAGLSRALLRAWPTAAAA
mmetsp:Transcript_104760/g.327858  ORF Transcript_104760/g.327858 Transcript_104760/m.327858 type:complete len:453 (+) Transcript_104760:93-1451(+)